MKLFDFVRNKTVKNIHKSFFKIFCSNLDIGKPLTRQSVIFPFEYIQLPLCNNEEEEVYWNLEVRRCYYGDIFHKVTVQLRKIL